MVEKESKEFWIEKHNLPWLLILLCRVINYQVERIDLEMILYNLAGTSVQDNRWFAWQLAGDAAIDFRFARDMENTDILFIEFSFDKKISCAVDVCIFTVQHFYLSHKHYDTDFKIDYE